MRTQILKTRTISRLERAFVRSLLSGLLAVALVSPARGVSVYIQNAADGISDNTTNANVGIGTSYPARELEVMGRFRVGDGTNSVELFGGSSGGITAGHIGTVNNVPLAFFTGNGGPQLLLSTAGKVGVGTTTPLSPLHVGGIVTVAKGSENYIVDNTATLRIGRYDNGAGVAHGYIQAPSNESIHIWNHATYSVAEFKNDRSTLFHGNVGIGGATPTAALDVQGVLAKVRTPSGGWYIYDASDAFRAAFYDNGSSTRLFTDGDGSNPTMVFDGGNVGVGISSSPSHKLAVNGTIRAKEIIVDTGWADFVFEPGYRLAPLGEVEAHIRDRGHLPDIPSAAQIVEHGVSLGEMQKLLLQKIEELTLHIISLEKVQSELARKNERLTRRVAEVENQIP